MSRVGVGRAYRSKPILSGAIDHAEARLEPVGGAISASPPLQTAPDRALMRLEVLRLAHRHDLPAEQIVERAKVLATYVFDDQPADKF